MDRRYHVFVSSTFGALSGERQSAFKSVLQLNQLPTGVDLFPASDAAAWELTRDVVEASDYYVLLVPRQAGSVDAEGIDGMEREYEYALRQHKSILAFVQAETPGERAQPVDDASEKLDQFRKRVEASNRCSYWSTTEELDSLLVVALSRAFKHSPTAGWVRGDEVPDSATVAEVLRLRERIEELEQESGRASEGPPPGTEDLEQGQSPYTFPYEIRVTYQRDGDDAQRWGSTYTLTYKVDGSVVWDDLFAAIGPGLIQEEPASHLMERLRSTLLDAAGDDVANHTEELRFDEAESISEPTVQENSVETCLIQFRALGLIKEQHSVTEATTYWTLTPYGERRLLNLRAIRKPQGQ